MNDRGALIPDRLRLPFRFDAAAMRDELRCIEPSDWIDHYVPQNYEGTWNVVPLRAPAGAAHPIQQIYADASHTHFVDTPLLARSPYFQQLLSTFHCPLTAVRLMNLVAGSRIKPHADDDLSAEFGRVRLHIPVITNPDVDFWLNGTRVVMSEGECWYLRLSDTHSVANRGQVDRVHLVIDALLNAWLQDQLMRADSGPASPDAEAGVLRVGDGGDAALAQSGLERFRTLVARDDALRRQLMSIDDRATFVAVVLRLASDAGCATTADAIETAMRETRKRRREMPA